MNAQNESGRQTGSLIKEDSKNDLQKERPPDPLENVSIWSRVSFSWIYPLLKEGKKRTITEADLPNVSEEDSSAYNQNLFEKLWKEELERVAKHNERAGQRKKKKPSLHRAILGYFLVKNWFMQVLYGVNLVMQISQGISLGYLVETFVEFDAGSEQSNSNGPLTSGYFHAFILVLSGTIMLFTHHLGYFISYRIGTKLKNGTIASIYSKSLRLRSIGGIDEFSMSTGKVINLATNDAERFIVSAIFFSYIYWGPLLSIIVLIVGIFLLGPAFAAGYVILVGSVPLQFFFGKRLARLRSETAAITDSRITLVAQAVSGVRVMKMSGWEQQFNERIAKIRKKEMSKIQQSNRLKAWNEAIFFMTNTTVVIIILLVHVSLGENLSPKNVFTTMALINAVQKFMSKFFPLAVSSISECYVSIKRLQDFLEFPELPKYALQEENMLKSKMEMEDKTKLPLVSMVDAVCYWDVAQDHTKYQVSDAGKDEQNNMEITKNTIALQSVNIDFYPGKLYCLIGPVGCGKSALIQAIAGELPCSEGKICRHYSSVSYSSQDAWIMNGTIKENILMGSPYKSDWYNKIVGACGLSVDFTQFQRGDETIVGDRGVQCSGGQKARIGLARALYRDADIILLDDPLSAVDSNVGRLIFYSAIQDLCVKRGKCVVLATHQHQFIGDSKCIFLLRGGIEHVGSFRECIEKGKGFLMNTTQAKNKRKEDLDATLDDEEKFSRRTKKSQSFDDSLVNKDGTVKENKDHEEKNSVGDVKWSTWLEYASALGGLWNVFMLFVLILSAQVAVLVVIAFIGKWAEMSPIDQRSLSAPVLVVGLGIIVIILSIIRSLITYYNASRASQRLHDRMTWNVLRAKIEFFDTNPLGRILNRFAADVGINDDQLPSTLIDFLVSSGICLGSIVTTMSVLPFTILAFLPLLVYFIQLRRIFLSTSRELKRIDGVSRSPIHAMLNESLSGIATIRANSAEQYFRSKFELTHDSNIRAFFSFIVASRWIGFRLDACGLIFVALSSFSAVLFNERAWFNISPAILGLALSMLLQLSSLFQYTVRQSADVVNQMVSVERVYQFSIIPSEPKLCTDEDNIYRTWPDHGSIEVENLSVRYRASLPKALKNVSFKIKSGQRVGIVGRTGCGKSTLVQAFFRLLDAEQGSIRIDGADISKLGLHKLRTKMSVIPQYPVLFSGCSIRQNLDPFNDHNVETIKEALNHVQMLESVLDLPDGLNSMVAEGGSNFSVGQRQLICLARAILRKSKILILDEPTANVDGKTDFLLQKAVSTSFSESTIIAIAHRLDTIIGYDVILVLGMGELLEIGSPRELLAKKNGVFTSMVESTGEENSSLLRNKAFGKLGDDDE